MTLQEMIRALDKLTPKELNELRNAIDQRENDNLAAFYSQIPDYLQPAHEMLKCAFPNGVSQDEYWALISLLHAHFSFRNLAHLLGVFANKSSAVAYNDVSGFTGRKSLPAQEDVERVRQKLIPCGFAEWVKEDS